MTNISAISIWSGTRYWTDEVYLSKDPTFIYARASRLATIQHSVSQPFGPGQSYEVAQNVSLPAGSEGDYFVYVLSNVYGIGNVVPNGWPLQSGGNVQSGQEFATRAFEDPAGNVASTPLTVLRNVPDLQVTDLRLPNSIAAGASITVTATITNVGERETQVTSWRDGLYLSRDASLDSQDYLLRDERDSKQIRDALLRHDGILLPGESYEAVFQVSVPFGIEGDFYFLAVADSAVLRNPFEPSNIGFGLPGVTGSGLGDVKEYEGEGNNSRFAAASILPSLVPDLQVTRVDVPLRVTRGQPLELTYRVTNVSAADTPPLQGGWDDLVYLSRDPFLDLDADRYLASHRHSGGLAAGAWYERIVTVTLPTDVLDAWYVFVVTDPARNSPRGSVYEGNDEHNNARASTPMVVELPPPTDLVVTQIEVPSSARPGQTVQVQWQVTNLSQEPATGQWSDSVYLSSDATWDIQDRPLGRMSFSGTLGPGEAYSRSIYAVLPPVTPGDYRAIVRTDIFNQVYEAELDANNATASPGTIQVAIDTLTIGIPQTFDLAPGGQRLYQITVPAGQTLRITLDAGRDDMVNELFVRHNAAPTSAQFDATSQGPLAANLAAVVPSTQPGQYYVMVRGFSGPEAGGQVTLLAELLPLAITQVSTDVGGDSRHVTTRIEGAQFRENAVVKLVRPGIAEFEPVAYEVVNSSLIVAAFDLSGAPHGLYDVKVINPDGQQAVLPYRFLVQRAIEPEVTIGLGGPRVIAAGDVGNYSVSFQNLGNLDAPYTFFQVGAPELGLNPYVYGLPYLQFFSNVRGTPDGAAGSANENVPWVSLESITNTTGQRETSGYLFDHPADGYGAFAFNVATYPGLRELAERAFDQFRAQMAKKFPDLDGLLEDGAGGLDTWWEAVQEKADDIAPGLGDLLGTIDFGGLFDSNVRVPGECETPFIPYPLPRLCRRHLDDAQRVYRPPARRALALRESILADEQAPAGLLALAGDPAVWADLYLAALEDAGLLRPAGSEPPIRTQQHIVSLMAVLSAGLLFGPAGSEIRATGDLLGFFEQLRTWYGHADRRMADIEAFDERTVEECGVGSIPIPALPAFDDFDLGLSRPTRFEAFRIFVPWIPFENRGSGLPVDFQLSGTAPIGGEGLQGLDFAALFEADATADRLASLTGPLTFDTGGWLPAGQSLPYTIGFENAEGAPQYVSEIRVVSELDSRPECPQFCPGRHAGRRDHDPCARPAVDFSGRL